MFQFKVVRFIFRRTIVQSEPDLFVPAYIKLEEWTQKLDSYRAKHVFINVFRSSDFVNNLKILPKNNAPIALNPRILLQIYSIIKTF